MLCIVIHFFVAVYLFFTEKNFCFKTDSEIESIHREKNCNQESEGCLCFAISYSRLSYSAQRSPLKDTRLDTGFRYPMEKISFRNTEIQMSNLK